ncbi:MAG: sortase [Candidatus Roizmanbacteria bacterium]|nr:sortase [Candidatus Roizmanbacteria bacterium]
MKKKESVLFVSYIFIFLGTITLLWTFAPILLFQASELLATYQNVTPVPKSVLASSLKKGMNVYENSLSPYYSSYLRDFTHAGQWFPQRPQHITNRRTVDEYTVSIPKLNLVETKVKVASDALDKSLVQYGDDIYPGEAGNAVVLGHSTLPQLYKDNDPKSIFTYLPSIDRGDEIQAQIGGFTYTFIVYDIFIVDPKDTWVLDPKADESILTLITCVPPGTYQKRLIVKSRLKHL